MSGLKYPSRKDAWLGVALWGTVVVAFIPAIAIMADPNPPLIGVILIWLVAIATGGLVLWVWFGTYYELTVRELIVRSGPFKTVVPLATITRVTRTRSPLSSPALSMRRLEIRYRQYSFVLISPAREEHFLEELRKRCPAAKIDA